MIRKYKRKDAARLTAVHNILHPSDQHTHRSWQQHMENIQDNEGHVWALLVEGSLAGYTAVLPVPSLPGLVEIEGFIVPRWQRQGWGSQLLHHIKLDLAESEVRQLSYPAPSLETAAARFLQKNDFFIEHEEWTMSMVNGQWSTVNSQRLMNTRTYPRQKAISLFCRLYPACFEGLPWNQPYSEEDVVDLLEHGRDLHFLLEDGTPVGFVWVQRESATAVTLEPIGIIQGKQGQGYGRILLQTILQQLTEEGVTAVTIGVWANNQRAIHLYQSLGFQHTNTLTYLAYNISITQL
ncbi:MAG: GNAT family N-acetyltransferase [Chloroflexi bacterium]|nr:GNAT family N-acetyltransferase [Chloroflexota bacterium]